jgi:hypothetical protein
LRGETHLVSPHPRTATGVAARCCAGGVRRNAIHFASPKRQNSRRVRRKEGSGFRVHGSGFRDGRITGAQNSPPGFWAPVAFSRPSRGETFSCGGRRAGRARPGRRHEIVSVVRVVKERVQLGASVILAETGGEFISYFWPRLWRGAGGRRKGEGSMNCKLQISN